MVRLLAIFLLAAGTAGCSGQQSAMVKSCRSAIERWQPIFAAVEPAVAEQSSRPLSRDEYRAFLDDGRASPDYIARMLVDFDAGKRSPTRFIVRLVYGGGSDASGSPVKTVACSYDSFLDTWPDPAPGALAIEVTDTVAATAPMGRKG